MRAGENSVTRMGNCCNCWPSSSRKFQTHWLIICQNLMLWQVVLPLEQGRGGTAHALLVVIDEFGSRRQPGALLFLLSSQLLFQCRHPVVHLLLGTPVTTRRAQQHNVVWEVCLEAIGKEGAVRVRDNVVFHVVLLGSATHTTIEFH